MQGAPANGQRAIGSTLLEFSSMTKMVQVMIEDQELREHGIAEEYEQCNRDMWPRSVISVNAREKQNEDAWSGCNRCSRTP